MLWSEAGQCYITPVGAEEISVAVITNTKGTDYRSLLSFFPSLNNRLPESAATGSVRGSLTASRRLRRVSTEHIALVGDASGSVDAITGEGISIALEQARVAADAMQAGDLRIYSRKHPGIMRRPAFMAQVLSTLSNHHGLRSRVLKGLAKDPQLFGKMLSFHVGSGGLRELGFAAPLRLGASLMRAG